MIIPFFEINDLQNFDIYFKKCFVLFSNKYLTYKLDFGCILTVPTSNVPGPKTKDFGFMIDPLNITVRPESRLDAKWLKTDLQRFLRRDGLAELWNEMIRDGEIIGAFSDGLMNSAGVIARKGDL